jgi:Cu(I)/Ag(I) efflux system membrane fusion protein
MNKTTVSVLVLCALIGGFLAGSSYTQREAVGAAGVRPRKILHYVDPMHPSYKSDKPGTAPDCGMPLEPVYADDRPAAAAPAASGRGVLTISAERQRLIGVQVRAAEKTASTEPLRLFGRVAPEETRLYRMNAGADGVVREISSVTTGSQVTKDQWLASVSAPETRAPIQGYLVALDILERGRKAEESPEQINQASAGVQSARDRLLTLGMSSVQIEEIARTRKIPSTLTLTAPHAGFVIARNVSPGQTFEKGIELYRIADLSRVWIMADVFGHEAEYVRPGLTAQVTLPGRTRSLSASVSSEVLPQFDPVSQSIKVRLDADNPDYLFRPDMFVDVDLLVALPPSIAVSVDALVDSGRKKTIFVERGSGVFEPREVETGWRFGGRVEIVKGIAVGDRVVVSGAFLLDSETRMRHTSSEVGSRP